MRKILKILGLNILAWLLGTALIVWLWMRWWKNNPVEIQPDGTMPGDSVGIPIFTNSITLLLLLIVGNALYFTIDKFRRSLKLHT